MSLKSAPFYWVECDDCGRSAQECADVSAWMQQDVAEDEAVNADWYLVARDDDDPQDGDYCEPCARKRGIWWCEGCGELRRITLQVDDLRWCARCHADIASGEAAEAEA